MEDTERAYNLLALVAEEFDLFMRMLETSLIVIDAWNKLSWLSHIERHGSVIVEISVFYFIFFEELRLSFLLLLDNLQECLIGNELIEAPLFDSLFALRTCLLGVSEYFQDALLAEGVPTAL